MQKERLDYALIGAGTGERQARGDATLFLPDGIRLTLRQAQLTIVPTGSDGKRGVRITPLPAAAGK